MRLIVLAACSAFAGCRGLLGFEDVTVVSPDDAPLPPVDVAPIVTFCAGSIETVCLTAPAVDLTVGSEVIDTKVSSRCAPTDPGTTIDACVVFGKTIVIDGNVLAVGSRPLILFAIDSISVGMRVAVASAPAVLGAGARICPDSVPPSGGGGGSGGTLGAGGGNGGNGDGGGGGAPPAPVLDGKLVGGCRGDGGAGLAPGSGGSGGGAVALIAPQITVTGTIDASGSGGGAGGTRAGGGGGGSGGMIVLDGSVMVTIDANGKLLAQGGGGGGGGADIGAGFPGAEAVTPGVAGRGGFGADGNAGTGGNGGTSGIGNNGQNAASGGGGGGGGGTGVIRLITPDLVNNGSISPPPRSSASLGASERSF